MSNIVTYNYVHVHADKVREAYRMYQKYQNNLDIPSNQALFMFLTTMNVNLNLFEELLFPMNSLPVVGI